MATGLILGPDGRPLVDREVYGRCTVPGCDLIFYAGEEQAWQRHVGRCARANMDRIQSVIESRHLPVFDDWDPEVTAHFKKVRARMEAEGRWELKPRERTGTV